jgi:hypothetical protein
MPVLLWEAKHAFLRTAEMAIIEDKYKLQRSQNSFLENELFPKLMRFKIYT